MSNMAMYLAEFVGTAIMILFGSGVVANVSLKGSKGKDAGWNVITTAWGLAVAVAAYITGWVSGAHLNPAVSIAFAIKGDLAWSLLPGYVVAQVLGAMLGATLTFLTYKNHFDATDDKDTKLGIFATIPAIENHFWNLVTEIIGTAILIIGLMGINHANNGVGPLSALLAGFLVWVIGLSLGGPTGYAINPARDFGPRLAHALLPIKGKGDSKWSYAYVPIVGPIIGSVLGTFIYKALLTLWV